MNRFNLSAWAVGHPTLVLFLILMLSAAGAYAYTGLGRAEDPSFTIKQMNISALWPGATAEDMQRLVADPIERTLQEVPHFDRVRTYSRPGAAYLQVQLDDATPPAIVKELWYQVRKRVGDMAAQLPAGVIGPFFNDEFGDVDSALYVLTGDAANPRTLKDQAEDIRQRLLRVPDVTKVRFYGTQAEKIFVEFSHAKLATLGLTPQDIFNSVARQNAVAPAGAIETSADKIYLRVSGAVDGAAALAAVPVEAAGRLFRLGDVATVSHGFEDPPSYAVRYGGKPALAIGVVMAEGANIETLGKRLETATAGIRADLPVGFELSQIADQPKVVEESVGEFLRAFVEALVIVLVVSFLSLGWRSGIVVALAVPLVLAVVMIVMELLGMSLERISLGALIIALGLLVDDAIIATEMMIVKMEEGFDRLKAASFAWTSTAFPMLTGTLVTAAGFLPVGFAQSATSEYAGGIFWVVAIALLASWLVAVLFTPYLGVKLLPEIRRASGHGHGVHQGRIYRMLEALVRWCVRRRILVTAATVGALGLALWSFQFVPQQFFPASTRPEVVAELRLPEGSAFGATARAVEKLERAIAADPEVSAYTSYVGGGMPRFFLTSNIELPNSNYAVVVMMTADEAARDRVKARLEAFGAEGGVSEARLRVSVLSLGPPVGFPVQFRVIGPDPAKVREIAYQVRATMQQEPTLRAVNLDWNEQAKAVRLEVDQDRARALGLTPQDVAQALQMLLTGVTVTQVRDGIELVDVVARAAPQERLDLEHLGDLVIATRGGRAVPLAQVARIVYGHEEPILWRLNRDMLITVRGDVVPGVQPPDVSAKVWTALAGIRDHLPIGYRLEIGGAAEESGRANAALAAVYPVMALVMLVLLMVQLQSFPLMFLVLATGPLGLIGAIGALLASGRPFGFVALLGVIALAGMIMRNSVILVDQIGQERAAGADPFAAIVTATVRRARPVVLTALAAVLAMIPLAGNLFWGPMAIAIMGGLIVATVLTLTFVPALYGLWFRVKAAPAAAEPASPRLPAAAVPEPA